MGELSAVRVLDTSESIGGAYCAKLLGHGGAEVLKLERPGGDPMRTWSCAGPGTVERGAHFSYLHAGHSSVVIEDAAHLDRMIAAADVVITDPPGPGPDPAALAASAPDLVVVSVTPYGLTGPWAGRPGSELTVQAASGALAVRGHPSRPPFQAGGQVTEWLAGVYGAVGALAALNGRDRSGLGDLIDVSWAEVANLSCTLFADISDSLAGRPDPARRPARSLETPSIEPTADGYVGFNTNTAQQFSDFLVLIGRTDLLEEDPAWSAIGTRLQRWDEWNEIVHAWTTQHPTEEIVETAALLRIPVAPVNDAEMLMALDHMQERGVFQADAEGLFQSPRRPWIIDGEAPPAPAPAPRLGQCDVDPEGRTGPPRPAGSGSRVLPAEGLKVLDLTTWWAGPSASGLLAGLGADVVHVESVKHPDGMRMTGGMFAPRDQWWELSGFFISANANKRDVTLDLSVAEGRDLLLRLVADADVVMDNFSPRVLERFDLGWDVIHATNPRAVMVRMPAFGLSGPWRDRPGFAQTMEQVTGMAWITGFVDDQPRIQRGPCDPNAGMHAVFATLLALRDRDRTGQGSLIEVAMVEAALAIAAEPVIEWTAYGNRLSRAGNRSPRACPQGVYAAAGEEQWLALSVLDDRQWAGLRAALGDPAWAADPKLESIEGRRAAEDELDKALAEWAAGQDVDAAVDRLAAHGVPAAAAHDPRRVSEQPQFAARGFFEPVDHPTAGRHAPPSQPFRMGAVERWTRSPAPTFGQHNAEVLGALGLGPDDLARLEAAGVIGQRPLGL